jgi:hypothetical protein
MLVVVFAGCLLASACGRHDGPDVHVTYWKDLPSIAPMPEYQAISSGVRMADSVTFYEGLPHPLGSREEFASELATKKTTEIHGRAFYEQPLVMDPQDLERFRAACLEAENFRVVRGMKLCGGFHPDYLLSWRQGERRFDFEFCFGCGEAKMFLGDQETLYVDMRTDVFADLLEKYRAQRPEHAPFPR